MSCFCFCFPYRKRSRSPASCSAVPAPLQKQANENTPAGRGRESGRRGRCSRPSVHSGSARTASGDDQAVRQQRQRRTKSERRTRAGVGGLLIRGCCCGGLWVRRLQLLAVRAWPRPATRAMVARPLREPPRALRPPSVCGSVGM